MATPLGSTSKPPSPLPLVPKEGASGSSGAPARNTDLGLTAASAEFRETSSTSLEAAQGHLQIKLVVAGSSSEKPPELTLEDVVVFDPKAEPRTHFSDVKSSSEDMRAIKSAFEQIGKLLENSDKPRMVYLAVGAANSHYGNPSNSEHTSSENISMQQHPPMLLTARQEGFQVITINIDAFGDEAAKVIQDPESGDISAIVNARYPLSFSGQRAEVVEISHEMKALVTPRRDKSVVLNAVSNQDYRGLTQVAKAVKGNYLTSYLETGTDVHLYKYAGGNKFATHSEPAYLDNLSFGSIF